MATIRLEVDDHELWQTFWGSSYETDPVTRNWLMSAEYLDGADWDTQGTVRLWYIPEGGDDQDSNYWGDDYQKHCQTRDVTIDTIADALSLAMAKGYRHVPCGGAIDTDFDNWDNCVTDILLQLIAYGKEVWA